MKSYLLSFLFCIASLTAFGQSPYLPLDQDTYQLIDRYQIKLGAFSPSFNSTMRAYTRKSVAVFMDTLLNAIPDSTSLSKVERFNISYLLNDNWEWTKSDSSDSKKPFWRHFYKKKSDFFQIQNRNHDLNIEEGIDNFDIHLNPVLHFGLGMDSNTDDPLFVNTRGVQLRGVIANKLGFYTYVADNQAAFPSYVREIVDSTGAVPSAGFWKDFKTNGVDFLTARGYLTFSALKVINFQFGNDRHFIGEGYRSLFLSDYSAPYLFLKINTRFWKVNYTNLYTQLTSDVQKANNVFPKKYAVFHRLSIDLKPNFQLGLFESVIFTRHDNNKNDTFDLAYLNPMILYRSVEQGLGSADNAILGLDFSWIVGNSVQLYGQLLLDEFKLDEVKAGNGWWANKQAFQLGAKYIDALGIKNLDLQAEVNTVRPYTYTHFSNNNLSISNYSQYNQPLAHPLGANFRELIGIVRYQPLGKLRLTGKVIFAKWGEDDGQNRGGNILQNSNTRAQEYDNFIGQGIETKTLFADLTMSYQLKHNLFIDLKQVFRNKDSQDDTRDLSTTFTSFSVRLNIAQRLHEF
jgi:hypothetical protein